MKSLRHIGFVLLFLLPALASAVVLPADNQVIIRGGRATGLPGNELRLLVWNVHKASRGEVWVRDFTRLMADADVAFVQESHLVSAYRAALRRISSFETFFAVSFLWNKSETGVMSATRWPGAKAAWYRSADVEPILSSPKMAVSLTVPLADKRQLLALNVHSLNFVPDSAFRRQLIPLILQLRKHQGPAVFAGDFNTWSSSRTSFLLTQMKASGFSHVSLDGDQRSLKLDHVFARGLKVRRAVLRNDIMTSDHKPIQAVFTLNP